MKADFTRRRRRRRRRRLLADNFICLDLACLAERQLYTERTYSVAATQTHLVLFAPNVMCGVYA